MRKGPIPLAMLALAFSAAACQSYGTKTDCQDLSCSLTCSQDADCAAGQVCAITQAGCCSECRPLICESDADCTGCEVCETDSGRCLAPPCAEECSNQSPCPSDSICVTDARGCCGRCELVDPCADLDCYADCQTDQDCQQGFSCQTDEQGCCGRCEPDDPCLIHSCVATCASDSDCAPGDFCHVYADGCCSECRRSEEEVVLVPHCAHAPHLVSAGQPFPLAVFGYTGCAWYDRIEVASAGYEHTVRVIGLASADPDCPQLNDCDFSEHTYIGMVWLPAPNPGAYTVTVSGAYTFTVGASGGIVEPPACQDDCPAMGLDLAPWSLTYHSGQAVAEGCRRHLTQEEPILFDGSCQEYTAVGEWPYPDWTVQCTEQQILFGQGPLFEADASFCPVTAAGLPFHVLGIGRTITSDGEDVRAFLLESR